VARLVQARQGKARPGLARQHATRRGIRDNFSGSGPACKGQAGPGMAEQGNTSLGTVTQTIFRG
jgi:hypothetical protein